jgi:hypothetical protein
MSDIQRELDGCWEKVVELGKKNEELTKRNEELEFKILYHYKESQSLEKEKTEFEELKQRIKEGDEIDPKKFERFKETFGREGIELTKTVKRLEKENKLLKNDLKITHECLERAIKDFSKLKS